MYIILQLCYGTNNAMITVRTRISIAIYITCKRPYYTDLYACINNY